MSWTNILDGQNKRWLVTGAAGFIGSNLCHKLLEHGQKVKATDNFITGRRENIDEIKHENFEFIEGDLSDVEFCNSTFKDVDIILHQAALGSVPRSIDMPLDSHNNNVSTFIHVLEAARKNGVKRLVYASSSSVYGDEKTLPKVEAKTGNLLSPYALTKAANEAYASVYSRVYDMELVGLRYFNVFGQRQDPDGPYAAVIPRWVQSMIKGEPVYINGDGETSRDFTYVDNVLQINIRAGLTTNPEAVNTVYNVAYGERATLNELIGSLKENMSEKFPHLKDFEPVYRDFREGDIRHSLADISHAKNALGYQPEYSLAEGLKIALPWYMERLS